MAKIADFGYADEKHGFGLIPKLYRKIMEAHPDADDEWAIIYDHYAQTKPIAGWDEKTYAKAKQTIINAITDGETYDDSDTDFVNVKWMLDTKMKELDKDIYEDMENPFLGGKKALVCDGFGMDGCSYMFYAVFDNNGELLEMAYNRD